MTFEELDNENQFIQCSRSFEGQTIAGLFNAGNNEVEREFFGEVALSQNVDIVGKKAVIKKNGFLITKG